MALLSTYVLECMYIPQKKRNYSTYDTSVSENMKTKLKGPPSAVETSKNPSIINIIRWFAGLLGRSSQQTSV